jgi:hypothetical protein
MIDRIEIQLTPNLPSFEYPSADVTFLTTSRRRHGNYELSWKSRFFRKVEIEVDYEDGAINPEPYDTRSHDHRPSDLRDDLLTLETAYGYAGVEITRNTAGTSLIDSSEAGRNERWSSQELHDSMELYWTAFANIPQWKMWIFLAEKSEDVGSTLPGDRVGGIMFDGSIDEPGGVDRQGAAIFTRCPALHGIDYEDEYLDFASANSYQPKEAIARELFFNLMHESGHAFNLYHPWIKTSATPWPAPAWMPARDDKLMLTWMNYPGQASRIGREEEKPWRNVEWFYKRFRFRFDDAELLFLRHAPQKFVMMGGEEIGVNHAIVLHSSFDSRMELLIRARKKIFELGEPVIVELRLKNLSDQPIKICDYFDLHGGLLQIAVTDPHNRRLPFFPFFHVDMLFQERTLKPHEAIYHPINLVVGLFGCPFKEPGAYRIEASYQNLESGTVAAVMQLYVRPPANFDDLPIIHELFKARVGRVLSLGGSRVMTDVLDKLSWVASKLDNQHPIQFHLAKVLSAALAHPFKFVDPKIKKIRMLEADPGLVVKQLETVVSKPEKASDTLGHIGYEELVNTYVNSALETNSKGKAKQALESLIELFQKRHVLPKAIEKTERHLRKLQ